jgi:hypothetical protein
MYHATLYHHDEIFLYKIIVLDPDIISEKKSRAYEPRTLSPFLSTIPLPLFFSNCVGWKKPTNDVLQSKERKTVFATLDFQIILNSKIFIYTYDILFSPSFYVSLFI